MSPASALRPDAALRENGARASRSVDERRLEEFSLTATRPSDGVRQLRVAAPGLRCGGCVASLENAVAALPGVAWARANLTAKTFAMEWREDALALPELVRAIEAAGFEIFPLDAEDGDAAERAANRALLTRVAVSGFAAANIMLLSVSVWAGADGTARDLMHWVSALIALPTVAYAGQPFFKAAWAGLRAGRLNMDAPISLAILLASGVSLSQVLHSAEHAYFDAAVTLIFLLLTARYLDGSMRAGARSAARRLARMAPRGAWVLGEDGARTYRPLEALAVGDRLALAPGERAPVDAVVEHGSAQLDRSLLTGESAPVAIGPGGRIEAGALSLDGALTLRATATAEQSTLAAVAELVSAAEDRKSNLARLADQAAAIYAPVVHLTALFAFIGWMMVGASAHDALLIAVAVLIVTCPCALGLAAPMAQAVACGALFRRGVMLKDGAALERLGQAKAGFFDKTGVLTLGAPEVISAPDLSPEESRAALALAEASRHPFAQAVAETLRARGVAAA
ncbi:MAG: heavy metal translocating P-type ATPase, partial [Pseudomonadota bacterium]